MVIRFLACWATFDRYALFDSGRQERTWTIDRPLRHVPAESDPKVLLCRSSDRVPKKSLCFTIFSAAFLLGSLSNIVVKRLMSTQIHGKGLLLKADPIAAVFREEVASSLKNAPRKPKLVGILATSSAPSRMYADFTKKQCEQFGVEFVLRKNWGCGIDRPARG